jgi:hypothetical protein
VPGRSFCSFAAAWNTPHCPLRPLERAIRLSTGHAFTSCFGCCRFNA